MSTCAELQTRLDALLTARDDLALGGRVVKVRAGEKEVQYSAGDGNRLDLLIRQVRLQMRSQSCVGCGSAGFIPMTPSDC